MEEENLELIVKEFEELTGKEVYEILKARAEIFLMEQNIIYLDMDDIDYNSLHCFFMEKGKVIAYLRAFYEEDKRDLVRIGRVLSLKHGNGHGKELMVKSIPKICERMKVKRLVMDAQKYAIKFYEKFNFAVTSSEFMEEGILHVKMELELPEIR